MANHEFDRTLRESFANRRILITGHTGFKGGWLSIWLKQLGAEVWGYALEPPTDPSFFEIAGVGHTLDRSIIADIRDADKLSDVFAELRPEIVFHLAAQSLVRRSYVEPKLTFDTNVGGTVNLLECVRETDSVRALVNITSDKCYENRGWDRGYVESDAMGGRDPYSASKGAAELVSAAYLHSFFADRLDLGAATARSGNVLGGGDWALDRIVPDAVRAVSTGQPVPVRNPNAIRPWQHVLEPLGGYLSLAIRLLDDPLRFSGAWNFGPSSDNARSVREVVETFLSYWGSGDWRDLSAEQADAPHEAEVLQLSCKKANSELGWLPRWAFDRTVSETARWYRAHFDALEIAQISNLQIAEYVAES
jgi:CDP-glucose 4,6-dehydratase